jgi:hypothetical protein
VKIVEVGARDGLQNEKPIVSQQLHMIKLDWDPGDLDQGLEFLSNQWLCLVHSAS